MKKIEVFYDESLDGRTTFAEIGDILDALADAYAWHPYVFGFLTTRALEARNIDAVMELSSEPTAPLSD